MNDIKLEFKINKKITSSSIVIGITNCLVKDCESIIILYVNSAWNLFNPWLRQLNIFFSLFKILCMEFFFAIYKFSLYFSICGYSTTRYVSLFTALGSWGVFRVNLEWFTFLSFSYFLYVTDIIWKGIA